MISSNINICIGNIPSKPIKVITFNLFRLHTNIGIFYFYFIFLLITIFFTQFIDPKANEQNSYRLL